HSKLQYIKSGHRRWKHPLPIGGDRCYSCCQNTDAKWRQLFMARQRVVPTALTIAGSDSGGGAGIQADLKTFASLGVHGASAITCVTAQNPGSIRDIQACDPRMVLRQIEAVFEGLLPAAVKTGMLFSREIVRVAAEFFKPRESP